MYGNSINDDNEFAAFDNLDFRENSLNDIVISDGDQISTQTDNQSYKSSQATSRRTGLINFSTLQSSTTRPMQNIDLSMNTPGFESVPIESITLESSHEKSRILPKRVMANISTSIQNSSTMNMNGTKDPFILPPLTSLLSESDEDRQKPEQNTLFQSNEVPYQNTYISSQPEEYISRRQSTRNSPPQSTKQSLQKITMNEVQQDFTSESSSQNTEDIRKTSEYFSDSPVPKEIDIPILQNMPITISIAFDQSTSTFHRLFVNEFNALMRPSSYSPQIPMLNDFIAQLSIEINNEVKKDNIYHSNSQELTQASNLIVSDVSETIDQVKQYLKIRQSCQETASQNYNEDIQEMKKAIDSYVYEINSRITNVMRDLEDERHDSINSKEIVCSEKKKIEEHFRNLKIIELELEAASTKQQKEFEWIDLQKRKLEVSDNDFIETKNDKHKTNNLIPHFDRQVDDIRKTLELDSYDDLRQVVGSAKKELYDELRLLQEEQQSYEIAQCCLLNCKIAAPKRAMKKKKETKTRHIDPILPRRTLVDEAKEKLIEMRKEREYWTQGIEFNDGKVKIVAV